MEGVGLRLREGLGFLVGLGLALVFVLMKLPKYGKTCVVLEGMLCYKFVTISVTVNFFHILNQLAEFFRWMYNLFGK